MAISAPFSPKNADSRPKNGTKLPLRKPNQEILKRFTSIDRGGIPEKTGAALFLPRFPGVKL
jgi:hypothetical protein